MLCCCRGSPFLPVPPRACLELDISWQGFRCLSVFSLASVVTENINLSVSLSSLDLLPPVDINPTIVRCFPYPLQPRPPRRPQVYAWDTIANSVDENEDDGRSFISAISEVITDDAQTCDGKAKSNMGEARMDIEDSEMAYLGFQDGESYGLSWKVRSEPTVNSLLRHNLYYENEKYTSAVRWTKKYFYQNSAWQAAYDTSIAHVTGCFYLL